jgi:DNA-binding CsgD family transcriptional regulator
MIFHRPLGDAELIGDLLVGQALRGEAEDVDAFRGQAACGGGGRRHVEDLVPLEQAPERLRQRSRAAVFRQAGQTPRITHACRELSRRCGAEQAARNIRESLAYLFKNTHAVFVAQAVVDEAEIDVPVVLQRLQGGRSVGDVQHPQRGDGVEERATEAFSVERVIVDEEEREGHAIDSTGTKIVRHPYLRTDGKRRGRSYGDLVTYDRARSLRLSLVDGTRSSQPEALPAPSDRISDVHPVPETAPSGVAIGATLASALAMLRPRRSIEGYTASGHALIASALDARFGFVAIGCPDANLASDAHGTATVRVLYALGHKQVDAPTVLAALHATPISGVHPVPVRRLQASCLLASGVEVFFVFERLVDERLEALRSALRPFAERVALGHGAGTGRALLTRREREAAAMLLGARAQKCFSDELGTSDARAREVVRNVYTKLGVSSRAELCAAWLGGDGANDELAVHEVTLQRPRPTR